MTIRLRVPLAAALVSSCGLLIPAASAASAATPVRMSDCGTLKIAPKSIVISCADANRSISGISWTNWGAATAVGKGILTWNTCTPTCVSGTFRHVSLTFRALRRVTSSTTTYYAELSGPSGSFGTKGTTWTLATPTAG
jgi:hypothetical protein